MTQKPPVPPEQTSDKVSGAHSPPDKTPEVTRDPAGGTAGFDTQEKGEAGNRYQNLTPQRISGDR